MRLFLRSAEIDIPRQWELVTWCHGNGASEFYLNLMGIEGKPDPVCEAVERQLKPFQLPQAMRPRTVVYSGQAELQPTPLWALTPDSISVLRSIMEGGVFAHPSYSDDGWIEDPTFYRAGAFHFGVVSHEDEGFVDLADTEVDSFRALGISTHTEGVWI
jgi:hypothetical protein